MVAFSTHLVNIWTDTAAAGYTMVDSILYLPEGSAPDVPRPGVVFVPGWAAYPYDTLIREIAPRLAEAGVVVLSVGMRRRGGEGQTFFSPSPQGDQQDITVALDALAQHGVHSSVLVGQDVGATTVVRYAATAGDPRVAGVALVDPVPDLAVWLRTQLGDDVVDEYVRLARQVTYEMKSDLIRIDVDVPREGRPPLWLHQSGAGFLAWWSPNPRLRLPHLLAEVGVPVLALGTEPADLEALTWTGRVTTELVTARDELAGPLESWALATLPRPARAADFELVETRTEGDVALVGYLTTPREGARPDVAVLVVHGLTTGPFSPMVKQFLPHYTDHGFAALAIETRRSGLRCVADSFPEDDNADIDAWIAFLQERGYAEVVLVGASLGSQAISRHVARRHHPAVVAVVHLAPTGDMPTNTRDNVGESEYARLTAEAEAAVAAGRGDVHTLVYDLTERGPSRFHAYRRTFWRAASWLAWWGPDAPTMHGDLMAEVDVPVLLVSGTADDYNDEARLDLLVSRAQRAPVIDRFWVGADHGLRGAEGEVTAGVVAWLQDHDLVERRDPPDPRPLAGVSARLAGSHVYPAPPTDG